FGALDPVRIVAMDREQDAAIPHHAFIALGFVFGHAHAYKSANDSADYSGAASPGQSGHEWARRNERSESWDRQCSDTGEQSERTADDHTGSCTSSCALGCLGAFFMHKILRASVVRQQSADIFASKPTFNERVDA